MSVLAGNILTPQGFVAGTIAFDTTGRIAQVSGTVSANLFHGTIDLESRQSDHSLFFPESRGLQSRSFNQQLCGPAAQIGGLPWEVLAKRNAKVAH